MTRRYLVALVVAGCGRVGFQPITDGAPARDGRDVSDGGGDATTLSCAQTRELCDGFEGAVIAPVWTVGPDVNLDATIAHRGASSLHVKSPALAASTGGYFTIDETQTVGLGGPTIYVRAWVRLENLPAGANGMELVSLDQTGSGALGDFLFVRGSGFEIYTQFSGQSLNTGQVPPTRTWLCMLWTVTRDASAGSIVLAGDPSTTMMSGVITDGVPAVSVIAFGIGFSGTNVTTAQPGIDVWIDDVIVDSAPISCAE